MRKILVSRGYGAGWSSWATDDKAQAVAEYGPIIEYVERGGPIVNADGISKHTLLDKDATWEEREAWLHPDFRALVKRMIEDLELEHFYTGGADGLTVEKVEGPYRIDEYDGNEYVTTLANLWSVDPFGDLPPDPPDA